MMTRVMLDLETFGTAPGSVIKAIGAVVFSPDGLGKQFYRIVDAQSCVRLSHRRNGAAEDNGGNETVRWSSAVWRHVPQRGRSLLIRVLGFDRMAP